MLYGNITQSGRGKFPWENARDNSSKVQSCAGGLDSQKQIASETMCDCKQTSALDEFYV